MNWAALRDYAVARAQETSTWRGLVYVLTSAGVLLSPNRQEVIVAVGLAVAGGIGALLKDRP